MKNLSPLNYILIALILVPILHFVFPIVRFIHFPWNLLGIIPLMVGIIINMIADRSFKKNKTTVKPFEKTSTLITDSVFGFSRNPMYLGFVFMLIGLCILFGSLMPFLVPVIFTIIMECVFIQPEEKKLEKEFKEKWIEYKKDVRKWI